MILAYTYTLEDQDRFILNGAIHEIIGELILNNEGHVVTTAGARLGNEVCLYRQGTKIKATVKAEHIVEELNCPGTREDLRFIYPGDPDHFANKGIMATIRDLRHPDVMDEFDVSYWFLKTTTNQVKELHAGNYEGNTTLKLFGDFYRQLNPRINRYFYNGHRTEILIDTEAVTRHLARIAPVLTGRLFKPSLNKA